MTMLLSDFARGPAPVRSDMANRVTAGLLTALFYGLVALLLWNISLLPRGNLVKPEIVTTLLPEMEKKREVEPVPPLPDVRISPERPAPPVFTIASGAPLAAAPLPATTNLPSPMIGGSSGNGPMGQAASGRGTGGSGTGSGGCLDPVWMRAVSERVRLFFVYPPAALATRTTGVAVLRFGVRRDGRIDKLEVARSSGNDGLDQAALDIVRRAQPLPPIPERMHTERVEGELPVNFGVRNFNARGSGGSC
jgi:protein TonB